MKKLMLLFALALAGCEPQSEVQSNSDLSKIKLEASAPAFEAYSTVIDGHKYIVVVTLHWVSVCPEIK
jgi:hypothetical protein